LLSRRETAAQGLRLEHREYPQLPVALRRHDHDGAVFLPDRRLPVRQLQEILDRENRHIRTQIGEERFASSERQVAYAGVDAIRADHQVEVACGAALECDRDLARTILDRRDRIIETVIDPIFGRFKQKSGKIVAEDLDKDGDIDIAVAGKLGVHFLENLKINRVPKETREAEQTFERKWPFPNEGQEVPQEDGPK